MVGSRLRRRTRRRVHLSILRAPNDCHLGAHILDCVHAAERAGLRRIQVIAHVFARLEVAELQIQHHITPGA